MKNELAEEIWTAMEPILDRTTKDNALEIAGGLATLSASVMIRFGQPSFEFFNLMRKVWNSAQTARLRYRT